MKRIFLTAVALTGIWFFTGCTASSASIPGQQTPDFKTGMHDGCTTATGEYTKNSEMFRNNPQYHEGWFYGRKKCNPSASKK